MKELLVCASAVISLAFAAFAATWQGGDGNWSDSTKWDVAPQAGASVSIPSGTVTVGASDLASLNGVAGVTVASGATLKLSGVSGTLSAPIAGAGSFNAVNCGSSGANLEMSGNNTGFTGPFDFTGCYVSVTTPEALGTDNAVTIASPADRAFQLGNFKTFNNLFVITERSEALYAPYSVTVNGKITTRGGYTGLRGGANASYIMNVNGGLHHDDSVTGDMNGTRITGFVRVTGDDLNHGLTGRDPKSAYPVFVDGTLYLKAPVSLRGLAYPGRIMVGGTLIFEKDECFDHTDSNYSPEIMYGSHIAGMKGSGTLDLNGTHQTINVFYFYNGASGNYHLTSGSTGGKLIMTKGGCTFNAKVEGRASVEYDSTLATPGVVVFGQASNTTSGGLHAKNGTIRINEGIAFPNLTLLKASNTGALDVFASSVPNSVDLELSESGTLSVGGDMLVVRSATVNGVPVGMGVHEAGESSAFGSHLLTGSVNVLTGPIEEKTYTWTGAGEDANLTTAGNWDKTPDFTIPEAVRLVFGADATRAVVNGKLGVNAVVICGSGFVLEGAGATSSLEIRKGGLHMTNPNATGYVTNTIAANLVFTNTDALDWNRNDWTFGERVCARFTGTMSGGTVNATTCFGGPIEVSPDMAKGIVSTTAPLVEVVAANGQLDTALVFSNVLLRAYEPSSLGSDKRYTTLNGNFHRPFETCVANTNTTPLRLANGSCGYLGASGVSFVQMGALTSYGPQTVFFDNTTFAGGIGNEYVSAGNPYPWAFYPAAGTGVTIQDKPLSVPGKHITLGNGAFYVNATNNNWVQFLFQGNNETLSCGVDGALPSSMHLYFKCAGNSRHYLELNGHDQTVQRAYALQAVSEGAIDDLEVHSKSGPATLTFVGDGGNFVVPIVFMSDVRFHWAGTGTYTLCNLASKATNGLEVSSGTLAFKWGAGCPNATDVTVRGTGTLKVEESSADVAFGGANSPTELSVGGSGKLDLPTGKTVTVFKANVNGEGLRRGTYGGAGTVADFTVPWITGGGVLKVRKTSGDWGMLIMIL